VVLPLAAFTAAAAPSRPNIIFILSDDQGYGDFSCHGNPILKTPNLDRLHDEGVRFTDFHVSPTCAPTRAALNTGRHEFRNGVTHTIKERERLALKAITIAQVLRDAGYTTGIFGKWHLGDEAPYQPNRRGFDEVFIHGAGGIGQTYPGSCGDAPGNTYFNPAILHNGKFEKTKGYCTDLFFAQAIRWMDRERQEGRPFFAYIPLNAAHAPHVLPQEYYKPYLGKPGVTKDIAKFFGMIENIDSNFGGLLRKLSEWGIEDNTLVIYLGTDNGGTVGRKIFNAGMRGGKGSAWEGGTRAPCFFRWPGVIPAGRECAALSAHIDIFPTLAEITGADLPDKVRKQVEGRSLWPLLRDPQAPWEDRCLFTHVGRWDVGKPPAKYGNRPGDVSIRNTRYNLVRAENDWELFDLRQDPGEKNDIAARHPDVVKQLSAAYDRWWDDVQPFLVNEDAHQTAPKVNPFKELYWQQFGGKPAADAAFSEVKKQRKKQHNKQ
jgi:arylsulfatase